MMGEENKKENYLIRNLESGFLEIHTGKEAYFKLPARHKQLLKNKLRWSNPNNCWISKSDFDLCKSVIARFTKIGFMDQGFKGKRIPFEKKIVQRLNKNILIAAKYDLKEKKSRDNHIVHLRRAERIRQELKTETDRFNKQKLKGRIKLAEDKAAAALDMANAAARQAIEFRQKSLILELNLSNPKYLKTQLYQKSRNPVSVKHTGKISIEDYLPFTDNIAAERLLVAGRFRTYQEQTQFYKNRLRTIASSLGEGLSTFYGKPVFLSKRWAEDGIGRVVGHQQEQGTLVLKLNNGNYIEKELNRLTVLAPTHDILNALLSKEGTVNESAKAAGLKALSMIKKGTLLEAMQHIQKVGLSKLCMVTCDQYLERQKALKKSLKRSPILKR